VEEIVARVLHLDGRAEVDELRLVVRVAREDGELRRDAGLDDELVLPVGGGDGAWMVRVSGLGRQPPGAMARSPSELEITLSLPAATTVYLVPSGLTAMSTGSETFGITEDAVVSGLPLGSNLVTAGCTMPALQPPGSSVRPP
jgi:hypothetical protein